MNARSTQDYYVFCSQFTMNYTTEENHLKPQIQYAVIDGFLMSLGFLLNAVALWILFRHHNLKSPSVVFMVNLAISDLLLVISLPLRVYRYATGTWPFGYMVCTGVNVLFYFNIRSSSIFITFISIDRLLAVVYPLRSRHVRTASNAVKAAILVWLCIIIMKIPQSVVFTKQRNNSFCFEDEPKRNQTITSIGIFELVFVLILLIVNIVSTVWVSWSLRKILSDSSKVKNKVNVMLIFVMNLVMFAVCFLPLSIGLLIKGSHSYFKCIATANVCLDPLLYYFSLDAFWKKKERNPQTNTNNMQTNSNTHRLEC